MLAVKRLAITAPARVAVVVLVVILALAVKAAESNMLDHLTPPEMLALAVVVAAAHEITALASEAAAVVALAFMVRAQVAQVGQ